MYTAVYKKVRGGYVAWIEEIPGVNTQGNTKREAEDNLRDALREFILVRRMLTKKESRRSSGVIRERLVVTR